jgi:hypothetical protein
MRAQLPVIIGSIPRKSNKKGATAGVKTADVGRKPAPSSVTTVTPSTRTETGGEKKATAMNKTTAAASTTIMATRVKDAAASAMVITEK